MSLQKFKLLATHCGTVAESPTRSPVVHLRRRKTLRLLLTRSSDRWRSPEIQSNADESTGSDGARGFSGKRDKIRSRRKLRELFVSSPPVEEGQRGGGDAGNEMERALPVNGVYTSGGIGEESTGRQSPRRDDVDILKLRTRCGSEIVAVYIKHSKANGTVLYSHDLVTENVEGGVFGSHFAALHSEFSGYDYSGYGQSTGHASESNTYADIEASYKCLKEKYGVIDDQLILYRQSVGSGPTVDLASRTPNLRGVGTADEVVDCSHGRRLWELSKEKYEPLWINGGGQYCDLEHYPAFIRHLKKFVASLANKQAKAGEK
ncbi:hypothetical protein YC2023_079524 [Brassica napus]